jgi:hypothetical protein
MSMTSRHLLFGAALAFVVPASAGPALPPPSSDSGMRAPLRLRLVPVAEGIAGETFRREPRILATGRKAGVDLRRPDHPLLVQCYSGGRLFYVFYKTVEQASGSKRYLIQRIRKIERYYTSPDDQAPEIRETFLVEAFKLHGGALKRADQHFASYGIDGYYKREVVKEYEIGYAEIEGVASGDEWPFGADVLYEPIQDYQEDRTLYDRVKFTDSKHWVLRVAFDRSGSYSVESPELGFAAPIKLPAVDAPATGAEMAAASR